VATKKKFYAVAVGRAPGIYSRWFGEGGAEKLVRGYPGAVYKSFPTIDEARQFLRENEGKKRGPGKPLPKSRSARTRTRYQTPLPLSAKPGQVIMYTDGGALDNPGPGGYGVVIIDGKHQQELSRGYRLTTNNRMELLACIVGLRALKPPRDVILYSDSSYVVNGVTKGWAKNWKAKNWVKSNGEPALNADLWEELLDLCAKHQVAFHWVKGHAGIDGNERCDQLATQAASGTQLDIDTAYEKNRHYT
jgi:ribonuclease HI